MHLTTARRWILTVVSALLQIVIFPIAGPMPVWRSWLAWIALMPLLSAILAPGRDGKLASIRLSALLGYGCGVLWYAGNCYWIYQTMDLYAGVGKPAALGILILFSLYLGLYHALFTWLLRIVARRGAQFALLAMPFLWVAVELARARITSYPWDQLGMSQIDSALTVLAPVTGAYGLSFVLAAVGSLAAGVLLLPRFARIRLITRCVAVVAASLLLGVLTIKVPITRVGPHRQPLAVLLQPNSLEGDDRDWVGDGYARHIEQFAALTQHPPLGEVKDTTPDLIVWPESPSPLIEQDDRFQLAASQVARANKAPLIVGDVARTTGEQGQAAIYNSASFFTAQGQAAGRYDKIHLVPFGEYIPFQNMFTFAKALTAGAGDMTPGRDRVMFHEGGHTYGVFICYESIFADEVRLFAKNGADVLVNISDDGWYGDTSAPWQHLNMARMRAIENRRWVLSDTNTGQTVSINPQGQIVQSAPAHVATAMTVQFEYKSDTTFYTRHGDVFAYAVTMVSVAMIAFVLLGQRLGHGASLNTTLIQRQGLC